MTIYRLKEFIREPDAVFWVFVFPLLLTLALGFAFRERPPERIPVGVTEGPFAQRHLNALQKSPALQPRIYPVLEGREELRRGKISLLVDGSEGMVYRYDPTRPESRNARGEVDDALQASMGRRDMFTAREETVTEQGARYIDFLVPGLLAMNLMGGGVWGIGWVIVENRIRKLLRLQLATPMRKRDFLLAHVLCRCVFVPLETVPLLLLARALFGVRVAGSLGALAVVVYAGALAFAGIGLLIASRVATNQGAMGFINLVTLPMYVLSGVFFSSSRFPAEVQPLLKALPLTALVDALRAVANHGASLASTAPELAVLAAWGALSFLLALKLFRWS
jgi:ABC-type multidrug transport system permease subunit